jgi:hypothetical protein
MTRYTPEETRKFREEEAKRDAEESEAYFAWKRGDAPLGTLPPKWDPPKPGEPSSAESVEADRERFFDDPLYNDQPQEQRTEKEDVEITSDSVPDIDSVNLGDVTRDGRQRKMDAMAEELHGFSVAQLEEAEQTEEGRKREAATRGHHVRDLFGQRFEEAPPKGGRK